ncbi:hypothetical protein FTUN_5193 [Frigoriglobus tundricola]|uniref:Uncharacterized protein n=1 Tax=Frigoriglobus tundricola TaxID=2774151 RepID=A0A6M5YU81_9BACT|nr:hypothetical protein FTUN_5193 [Frigoriglobus tundricola]
MAPRNAPTHAPGRETKTRPAVCCCTLEHDRRPGKPEPY